MDYNVVHTLKTPQGFVSMVLDNNLSAVNVSLQNAGLAANPQSKDQAYDMIVSLMQSGRTDQALQVLSVPFRLEATNGSEQYFPEVVEARNELNPGNEWPENTDWNQAAQVVFAEVGTALLAPSIAEYNADASDNTSAEAAGETPGKSDGFIYTVVAMIAILVLLLIALR